MSRTFRDIGGGGSSASSGSTSAMNIQTVRTSPMGVLEECLELMRRKAHDYQNPNSPVKQAMYYRRGVDTIYDIIDAKRLRILSLLEAARSGSMPKNESLEDSFKDMINYCAFAVSWLRGEIEGQGNVDMFNRPLGQIDMAIDHEDRG